MTDETAGDIGKLEAGLRTGRGRGAIMPLKK